VRLSIPEPRGMTVAEVAEILKLNQQNVLHDSVSSCGDGKPAPHDAVAHGRTGLQTPAQTATARAGAR